MRRRLEFQGRQTPLSCWNKMIVSVINHCILTSHYDTHRRCRQAMIGACNQQPDTHDACESCDTVGIPSLYVFASAGHGGSLVIVDGPEYYNIQRYVRNGHTFVIYSISHCNILQSAPRSVNLSSVVIYRVVNM